MQIDSVLINKHVLDILTTIKVCLKHCDFGTRHSSSDAVFEFKCFFRVYQSISAVFQPFVYMAKVIIFSVMKAFCIQVSERWFLEMPGTCVTAHALYKCLQSIDVCACVSR